MNIIGGHGNHNCGAKSRANPERKSFRVGKSRLMFLPTGSKSVASTLMVSLMVTRTEEPCPVAEMLVTFLKVLAVTESPALTRLYTCHMSSTAARGYAPASVCTRSKFTPM